MGHSLKIVIADPDPDYLGIEVSASNGRFSGATLIYAGLDELVSLAKVLSGFPSGPTDERSYSLGTRGQNFAGGYCSLKFYCRDSSGHAAVEVDLEDDKRRYSEASARFTFFPIVAGDIDKFVMALRFLQKNQSGEALIESHG